MKKLMAIATVSLIVAAFTMDGASARYYHHAQHRMHSWMTGGNAAMSGNNGNSANGSNSLGHVQGGNNGAGK